MRLCLSLVFLFVAFDADAEVDPARLAALEAHDRVEWSYGGGLLGSGSAIVVYDTDEVFARHAQSVEAPEETLGAYPAGTYARVRNRAQTGLAVLPDQTEPVICPDHGIDRVAVVTAGREVGRSRGCPVEAMIDLLDALSVDLSEARQAE